MSIAENIARGVGRIRGAYVSGVAKAFPNAAMNDPRAWVNISGDGMLYGEGKKPETQADAVRQFQSWVYVAVSIKAAAIAAVPLRTFGTIPEKGKKLKWAGTDVPLLSRPVSRMRKRDLESRATFQPYITKAEDVEELLDYPVTDLLRNVNPFSSPDELLALTSMFLDLTGESYWYTPTNKAGVPESIWLMPTPYVTPVLGKDTDTFIEGYKYRRGRVDVFLPFESVIRFTYPNPTSQIRGMSPVLGVADAVYNNSQMNVYEAALFENKARVDGIFQVDGSVAQVAVDRASEKFSAEYAGMRKAGKSPVLPSGMTFTPTTQTNTDLAFIEGRKLTREEICAGLNFPISLIDPNAIRANMEGGQYFLAKYGLEPILSIVAGGLNKYLVPKYDDTGRIFVAFDNPVPDDKAFELNARNTATGTPYMSINEARSQLGLDPVEGGDVPMVPFSMAPLGEERPEPTPFAIPGQPGKPGDDEDDTDEDEDDTDEQADELAAKTWQRLKEKLGVEA